jgi:hypothetical protein
MEQLDDLMAVALILRFRPQQADCLETIEAQWEARFSDAS